MKKLAVMVISAMLALPAFAQDQTTTTTQTNDQMGQTTTTQTTKTNYDDSEPREHFDVGAFVDYLRLQHASLNQYGVGGRIGFEMGRFAALEFEGAYNWRQNYSATISGGVSGSTTTETGKLRTVTFLVGPTIHSRGPVRVFGTVKGGILNFNVSNTSTGTTSAIFNGDTNGALYPAVGVELGGRHFGLRGEVGDLIYFDRGANQNFRMTVGPVIRF